MGLLEYLMQAVIAVLTIVLDFIQSLGLDFFPNYVDDIFNFFSSNEIAITLIYDFIPFPALITVFDVWLAIFPGLIVVWWLWRALKVTPG